MNKVIPLTRGHVALVDDADYSWLNQWTWYARINGRTLYAARGKWNLAQHNNHIVYMHREILNVTADERVDHKNGDGLDNRRMNLRRATAPQNGANSRRHRDNTSGFKGVSWNKQMQKWHAQIRANREYQHLGYFDRAEDAAAAYATASRSLSGEFARV